MMYATTSFGSTSYGSTSVTGSVSVSNDVQKTLSYSVRCKTKITDTLQYSVKASSSLQRALTYDVITTETSQKILGYQVRHSTSQTKSLTYLVRRTYSKTDSLLYDVRSKKSSTKSLEYAVEPYDPYSREAKASLPSNTTDLSTYYTGDEKTTVSTDNGSYVGLTGDGGNYLLHMFKHKHVNDTNRVYITWNGKASIAPSSNTVYFQMYNFSTTTWDTVDSDNATGANTDFTLIGDKTGTDYYDDEYVVVCRVYQSI